MGNHAIREVSGLTDIAELASLPVVYAIDDISFDRVNDARLACPLAIIGVAGMSQIAASLVNTDAFPTIGTDAGLSDLGVAGGAGERTRRLSIEFGRQDCIHLLADAHQ